MKSWMPYGNDVYIGRLLVYIIAYTSIVNASIYMNFREAVDALCASLSHEDVAKALGVSLQTVRQARCVQSAT
jgi:hypothetical protein